MSAKPQNTWIEADIASIRHWTDYTFTLIHFKYFICVWIVLKHKRKDFGRIQCLNSSNLWKSKIINEHFNRDKSINTLKKWWKYVGFEKFADTNIKLKKPHWICIESKKFSFIFTIWNLDYYCNNCLWILIESV